MKKTVYISAYLSQETFGKSVSGELKAKLSFNGYKTEEIVNHKKNVWCRDYMPVVKPSNKLVQFAYAPSYMMDSNKWRNRRPDPREIHKELKLNCVDAKKITLDGGAIEVHGKQSIISDRVFKDNKMEEKELLESIRSHLSLDRIIVVPQYPYDFTGHVDGMVRFIDSERVLINDLSYEMDQVVKDEKNKLNSNRCKLIRNWYYSFLMTFHNAGLKTEILPSNYIKNESDKDGNGIYMNFLKLPDLIVMPGYNDQKHDDAAKARLKEIYKREVVTVDASKLAKEGGMINCVTWTDNYSH